MRHILILLALLLLSISLVVNVSATSNTIYLSASTYPDNSLSLKLVYVSPPPTANVNTSFNTTIHVLADDKSTTLVNTHESKSALSYDISKIASAYNIPPEFLKLLFPLSIASSLSYSVVPENASITVTLTHNLNISSKYGVGIDISSNCNTVVVREDLESSLECLTTVKTSDLIAPLVMPYLQSLFARENLSLILYNLGFRWVTISSVDTVVTGNTLTSKISGSVDLVKMLRELGVARVGEFVRELSVIRGGYNVSAYIEYQDNTLLQTLSGVSFVYVEKNINELIRVVPYSTLRFLLYMVPIPLTVSPPMPVYGVATENLCISYVCLKLEIPTQPLSKYLYMLYEGLRRFSGRLEIKPSSMLLIVVSNSSGSYVELDTFRFSKRDAKSVVDN
ncbi:MAG: hypothetical protein ABWJ42_02090, partial [Sulfolobales archaeon]